MLCLQKGKTWTTPVHMAASAYRSTLRKMFDTATAAGLPYIDVKASDLYAKAGATAADKQMPNCCSVMRQESRKNATILPGGPPSGQGGSYAVRYHLPR